MMKAADEELLPEHAAEDAGVPIADLHPPHGVWGKTLTRERVFLSPMNPISSPPALRWYDPFSRKVMGIDLSGRGGLPGRLVETV